MKLNINNVMIGLLLTPLLIGGCATIAPQPQVLVIEAGSGIPLTREIIARIEKELILAQAGYEEEDYAGARQACERAGRLLYGVALPQEGHQDYYLLQSKCALLTVRLNRVQHDVAPEIDEERFTMPIPYNPRIERQLKIFLKSGRESFARWLRRSGKYVPILRAYFKEAGLPEDLVYVALIESGFNPRNRSCKQAVGLFQFIRGTAEMVGLKETLWMDERRHPEKAAQAAISHLQALYKTFKDWDLVLAAYNAGAGRVKKAMRHQCRQDYWQLSLPPETEAYVPKFYAALIIAKEPELYGFNPQLEEANEFEDVAVPGGVDLKIVADAIGLSINTVKDLNPELTKGCTPPGDKPYLLKLPSGFQEIFHEKFSQLTDEKKFLSKEELAKRKFKGVYFVYKVKSGDSLYTIARRHHTTVAKLTKWNTGTRQKKYIHPGQKLRIYRVR